MFDRLSWYLACRYLNSRQQNNFVPFVTVISLIGVALGTAILIIVLSVLNGFRDHIENKLLQNQPHIILEDISNTTNIIDTLINLNTIGDQLDLKTQIYPLIKEHGLIQTTHSIIPVNIISQAEYSYRPESQSSAGSGSELIKLKNKTKYKVKINKAKSVQSLNTVSISKRLADKLHLAINDKVIIAAPILKNTIVGPQPRFKRFTVKNIIDNSDSLLLKNDADILLPYNSALVFFDLPENYLTGLYIYIDQPLLASSFKQRILDRENIKNFNNIKVLSWYDYNKTLFQAIKLERVSIILLLFIIITIAAFNLISGLYIQVSEKRKDMAILRTYGLTSYRLSAIFVIQGLIIGLLGCFIGATFGLLISYNLDLIFYWLQNINLINTNNLFFNAIASKYVVITPNLSDVFTIVISALVICILATILPAYRASKILPIETLRHE